jgi:hypothetical protein
LGCAVPLGGLKQGPSWPLGSIAPSGGQRGPPDTPPPGRGLDLVDDGTRSRGRARLDVVGFFEQVLTSCGPQSLSKSRMPGLGVCCAPRGPQNKAPAGPWGASRRRGVKEDPPTHLPQGRGLDLVDDGTRSRGRARLDVVGFFEQVLTSCGPQSLSKSRMPGLGVCCAPRGPQNKAPAGPWGASRRRGVKEDPPTHLPQGRGLDLVDDGTRSRGRARLDVMGFFEQVLTSCGPQSLSKSRMPGLGVCCAPRGPQNKAPAGPWGASRRRGVKEDPPTHLPQGRGLDLVDDGTRSRGRARLDVMGFFEQVLTSCGPQSLSKSRMPGLGVCCAPRGPQNKAPAGPWGASRRRGVKEDPPTHLPQGRGLDLVDDGTRSRGRARLDVMGFFEQVLTSCGPQSLSKSRMPGLGVCCAPRGPQNKAPAGPWGASRRRGVKEDPPTHLPQGRGLDLVDDGTRSRGRARLDVVGFFEQVLTSCGPQSLSKSRMPGLGVCCAPRGPQNKAPAGPWGASRRRGVKEDPPTHLPQGRGLDLVDDGTRSRGRARLDVMGFFEQVLTSCGPQSLSKSRMPGLGVCCAPRGPQNKAPAGPWGASRRRGVKEDPPTHLPQGRGLDLVDDGTRSRGRARLDVMGFFEQVLTSCGPQSLSKSRMPGLGVCCAPRGPQNKAPAGPWGASRRRGVKEDPPTHLPQGRGLDLVDDGTRSRGRARLDVMGFFEQVLTSCGPQSLSKSRMPGLGVCCAPRGPQNKAPAGPWGASRRRGVKEDPPTHLPQGRGLDLVDDGTRSRGRARLDVMGFFEQVLTSCGPQSLSKSRMPGLGVCCAPRGPQNKAPAGPWGASRRRGVKEDPPTHLPQGRGLDLVDDGTRSRGRARLDVMGFFEQVLTSCGPQSLSKSRMPGLGVCCAPRGPQNKAPAGPWGASRRRGVKEDPPTHLPQGRGLDLVDDGTRSRGRARLDVMGFFEQVLTSCGPQSLSKSRMPGLGVCCAPRGPQNKAPAGPWGASRRRGVKEDPPTHLPQGRGLDLVDDGTRSRGRARLDVVGFFEQVLTSCGPQSLSKSRMPGLGVCCAPRGPQNKAPAGPWGASRRRGVKEDPPTHLPQGRGLDLVDDGTRSRGRARLDVVGFFEQVLTSCGPQSLSKSRMPGLGVCCAPRGPQNKAPAGPWGASRRRGVKEDPPTHLPQGRGLDLVDDGTRSRGRARLDVMGFFEQVLTSCGPQSLSKSRMPGLGVCCAPRGPQNKAPAGPWGASRRRGVKEDPPTHLPQGRGLDLVDDGTRSRGRARLDVMGFFEQVLTSCGPQSLSKSRMPGLGVCCAPRGPQNKAPAGPWGASRRRGVKEDPPTHLPQGRGLDLVDDGTRSRGRARLDVMGFFEQVLTSCGPQSLSKSRMPGLGVCCAPRGPQNKAPAGPWGASRRRGVKEDPPTHLPQGRGLDLVDDGTRSRGRARLDVMGFFEQVLTSCGPQSLSKSRMPGLGVCCAPRGPQNKAPAGPWGASRRRGVKEDPPTHLPQGRGLDLVDDGTRSRGRARLDVVGFFEQVLTSCGPQSLSKSRMPGLGVCCAPRGPQNKAPAGPWGASRRRGVKEDPPTHLPQGRGLDLVDDGTRSRGRARLDVMGFFEQVLTSCGPQSLSKSRMPGLGVCCAPRGPQNKAPAGPWGASRRRGVKEDPPTHLPQGRGLDLVDDGTRSRGRARLDVMGFFEQVLTSCGPQSLSKSRMPGLGVCCAPRGPQNKAPAGPWGASRRRGVKEDPPTHLPQGRGLDLVDDGTRSRGRARLDVVGFFEQVLTSCGPQSLSKSRMPGLGVCCAPRGPQNKAPAGPWGASRRRGVKEDLGDAQWKSCFDTCPCTTSPVSLTNLQVAVGGQNVLQSTLQYGYEHFLEQVNLAEQLTSSDFGISTGLINQNYWENSKWYWVNVERGSAGDKLSGRNINVSFINNSNVPIEVMIFIFYSDEIAIDVTTGLVTRHKN